MFYYVINQNIATRIQYSKILTLRATSFVVSTFKSMQDADLVISKSIRVCLYCFSA